MNNELIIPISDIKLLSDVWEGVMKVVELKLDGTDQVIQLICVSLLFL